ncbi:MAG TPA: DUF4262 domain-containing protein [Trebonia sp.]
MCWQCDTGGTWQDYLELMRGLVATEGWAVVGVEGDGVHPPFAYTVGLTPRDRPELVVTGLDPCPATHLLNDAAEYVLETAIPEPGETMRIGDGPLMEIARVAEPTAHLLVATEFYGKLVRALQLVYVDARGHWPWCPEFHGGPGGQPVLGTRAGGGRAGSPRRAASPRRPLLLQ